MGTFAAESEIESGERVELASAGPIGPSSRLTVLFMTLACVGLVMVASAASGAVDRLAFARLAVRQALWFALGLCAFFLGRNTGYLFWRRHNHLILAAGFVGLVGVLVAGAEVNGARRWIRFCLGGFDLGLQPSEFAKIALIIWTAAYCERNAARMHTFRSGFLLPMVVAGGCALLVLVEPDFGTTMLIGAVCTALLLVSGTRPVFVFLAGIISLPIVQRLVLGEPYRRARIMSFLDPWKDPQGAGYQLIQSKIAIGSGGAFGAGLGMGVQKTGFLPGSLNDFIFGILAEELGLVGSVAVVLLFVWIVWEGLKITRRARDHFGFSLAFGFVFLIGLQATLHVAVVTGVVPTKGLSLPLVSAGGSSLVCTMFAAGVLINIARTAESSRAGRTLPWSRDVAGYERFARELMRTMAETCRDKWRRARVFR